MTPPEAPQPPELFFVGVGIGTYDHEVIFPHLPYAVPEVNDVGDILKAQNFKVHIYPDKDKNVIKSTLQELLKPKMFGQGTLLVVLWSGHGQAALLGGLGLVARDTTTSQYIPGDLTAADLVQLAAQTGAGQILLILDTCFSGRAVLPAVTFADSVFLSFPPVVSAPGVWFGVIASSLDAESAIDGVFGELLRKLLREGPDDNELKRRWSCNNKCIQGDDIIDALMVEWNEPRRRLKQASLGTGKAERVFPNPLFKPPAPDMMDPDLRDAARGGEPGEDAFFFTGRTAELERIVAWIGAKRPGAFVVTGPPGIGKSAILGRIVSLSNPDERSRLLVKEKNVEPAADPGQGAVAAHVHALGYDAESRGKINAQLVRNGFLSADTEATSNWEDLQRAIQATGKFPVIVVDGLDETGSDSWRIAENVLRGLSEVSLLRGLSEVSLLLIGIEDLPPSDDVLSLINTLGAKERIDLGEADVKTRAETDLRGYVAKRLGDAGAPAMDPAEIAEIADTVIELSREQDTGGFLLARFVTAEVRRMGVNTSQPNWRDALLRGIDESIKRRVDSVPPRVRANVELPHEWMGFGVRLCSWFRLPKSHERRTHGHRHAGVRIVPDGPTSLVALDAHAAHPGPLTATDLLPYHTARKPPCQSEALNRRKIMSKARSKKKRPVLLAELENRYRESPNS